jgi:hypothetical protein
VIAKLLLAFALGVPLCLALNTAGCGPTCPNLQSCGTTTGDSDAGASSAGTGGATTCPQLVAQQDCLNSFCHDADNPFCNCYNKGFDLGADCNCAAFPPNYGASYCQEAADEGIDAASFDCSAASSAVGSLCIGVE